MRTILDIHGLVLHEVDIWHQGRGADDWAMIHSPHHLDDQVDGSGNDEQAYLGRSADHAHDELRSPLPYALTDVDAQPVEHRRGPIFSDQTRQSRSQRSVMAVSLLDAHHAGPWHLLPQCSRSPTVACAGFSRPAPKLARRTRTLGAGAPGSRRAGRTSRHSHRALPVTLESPR